MTKNNQNTFDNLKEIIKGKYTISIAILLKKKYVKSDDHESIFYVDTTDLTQNTLKSIVSECIEPINNVEKYTVDYPDSETNQARSIKSQETEFSTIYDILKGRDRGKHVVKNIEGIAKARAYMIVIREDLDIVAVGFRRIPENWGTRKEKGFISLFYQEERLEVLGTEPIFSIANSIDFIFYKDELFIFSKKGFELGLNYHDDMLKSVQKFYDNDANDFFQEVGTLKQYIGKNVSRLRKVIKIHELGIYKNKQHRERIKELSKEKDWNIEFQDEKIVITEENIKHLLYVLQDKHLYSDITGIYYNVDSATPDSATPPNKKE